MRILKKRKTWSGNRADSYRRAIIFVPPVDLKQNAHNTHFLGDRQIINANNMVSYSWQLWKKNKTFHLWSRYWAHGVMFFQY